MELIKIGSQQRPSYGDKYIVTIGHAFKIIHRSEVWVYALIINKLIQITKGTTIEG